MVVGGESYDEFFQNLLAVTGDAEVAEGVVLKISNLIVAGGEFAQAQGVVQQSFPQALPQPPQRQAPPQRAPQQRAPQQQRQPAGPPPGQGAPVCAHGWERVWKEGTSKAGKDYKMWACASNDRNDQCEPEWQR